MRPRPSRNLRSDVLPARPPLLRRAAIPGLLVLALATMLVGPISAATSSVSGSLTFRERVALSPAAVAIVTIVDHTAAADAGAVVGQQRIDSPSAVPIEFSVLVDDAAIVKNHAYGMYATIVDGEAAW